jgi:hypothetical protein
MGERGGRARFRRRARSHPELVGGVGGGALFVLHPARNRRWPGSRAGRISSPPVFALAAIVPFARARSRALGLRRDLGHCAFLLGVAAKPSVVVVPAVLWCHDVLVQRRPGFEALLKWPYLAAALFVLLASDGSATEYRQVSPSRNSAA